MSEYVTDPGTLPVPMESVIVRSLMVEASIASLNVIVMELLTETLCAPLVGLVKLIEGEFVSAGGNGPLPPHAERTRVISERTNIMSAYFFITHLVDAATKITPLILTNKNRLHHSTNGFFHDYRKL